MKTLKITCRLLAIIALIPIIGILKGAEVALDVVLKIQGKA